jgi:hypothetical protein
MTAKIKPAKVQEIHEEHWAQIKNMYYACKYIICTLYYINKLGSHFFNCLLLEKSGA